MRTLFTVAFLFIASTIAQAQAADYLIKLTPAQVQTIGQALAEMPYKQSAPLSAILQQQVDEQNRAAAAKKDAPAPK